MDSSTETSFIVDALKSYKPGNLPRDVFEVLGRVMVYSAIELIPLRRQGDSIEVLLFRRPSDDMHWPDMWHTPGTVLRPTDSSFYEALERIYDDELLARPSQHEPIYTGTNMVPYVRGTAVTIEYLLDFVDEPKAGMFYNVKHLPADFIPEQKFLVDRAVEAFVGFDKKR